MADIFSPSLPRTIFIGGLPSSASEASLQAAFHLGSSDEVILPVHRQSRLPKGYAFLLVHDPRRAEYILAHSTTFVVDGRNVDVQRAVDWIGKHEYRLSNIQRRVFLRHIPQGISREQLANVMNLFGKVRNIYFVARQNRDTSSLETIAFVEFESTTSAASALRQKKVYLHGQRITIFKYRSHDAIREHKDRLHQRIQRANSPPLDSTGSPQDPNQIQEFECNYISETKNLDTSEPIQTPRSRLQSSFRKGTIETSLCPASKKRSQIIGKSVSPQIVSNSLKSESSCQIISSPVISSCAIDCYSNRLFSQLSPLPLYNHTYDNLRFRLLPPKRQ